MTSTDTVLTCDGWSARFAASGALASFANGAEELVPGGPQHPILEIGGAQFLLDEPAALRGDGERVRIEYEPAGAGLSLALEHALLPLPSGGVALETVVTLTPAEPVVHDAIVRLPAPLSLGESPELFAPQKTGIAWTGRGGPLAGRFVWELAGRYRRFLGGYAVPLGLPLVSEVSDDGARRLTWCTDPYFTTAFFLSPRSLQDPPERELNWSYLGTVPMTEPEQRRVYACVHEGDAEDAIRAFYESALADVPPGPAWLHEIGWLHYDYFSLAGRGWFADLDTLAELVPEGERHRVCLCLHGWYDRLGRYAMDEERREIEESWRLVRGHDISGQAGVELTRDGLREMLRYARERGFRTLLYYGDGLVAGSDWAQATFPADAILRCTGWDEGTSHSVLLNPAHPEVRRWFLDYTRALTAAFGDDVDGFDWDETHYFCQGELGPATAPGYLDREHMTLVREIAAVVHEHRADLAFLGSDNVGVCHYCDGTGRGAVGYSLVADGCWQDSACSPEAWPFGIFPNFRNVHWSVNWWPVANLPATRYAVENFGKPVVTTNGYGENRPLAEFPADAVEELLALFRDRAGVPREPLWLTPGDPRTAGPVGTHELGVRIQDRGTSTHLESVTGG
ncbi:MAG TPA: hypothetical protein VFJ77_08240 [Gaiellaceae bacterium]|nr:hypothetical protein [Gaiellaceae bacterium]